jgi:hypothetical protein
MDGLRTDILTKDMTNKKQESYVRSSRRSLLCSRKSFFVGWDSSVGIAIRYRLDSPGIESRSGRDFPHPPRPVPEPIQRPGQWVQDLSPAGKTAGAWLWPPPSSAEVKERVELYQYSNSRRSRLVLGWILPVPVTFVCLFLSSFLERFMELIRVSCRKALPISSEIRWPERKA